MLKSGNSTLCGDTNTVHKERVLIIPSSNFFDLNDDCILEVLQYLTIADTFSLLGSFGSRFDEIALKRISQLKCLNFNLRDPPNLTPTQLQIIGENLKTLNFSVGYSLDTEREISRYFKPLCEHGTIQNLTLNYVNFKDSYQQCVLNLAANLKYLDLSFCQLTDDILEPILENCLNLQTLVIIGNYCLKGKSLHHIKSQNFQSITLELNDYCSNEVNAFIADNTKICVNVYVKGRSRCQTYHKGRTI